METQYHDITANAQDAFRAIIEKSWSRMSLRNSDGEGRPLYENRGLRGAGCRFTSNMG
jgi:hypothetical protein